MPWTHIGPPIDVRPLFPVERAELLALLETLDEAAWHAPTVCPGWDVHDLAAHVVHDYLRRLSGGRDGWSAGWIPVPDTVSWALPDTPAPVWLDVAREYTEFWVHQQQIRAAVGRPGADSRKLMYPVIDAFLRALPRTLADAGGSSVTLWVTAPIDEAWTARRGPDGWLLRRGEEASPDVRLELAPETLWQVATRGIEPAEALERTTVDGDAELAAATLSLVSIVR